MTAPTYDGGPCVACGRPVELMEPPRPGCKSIHAECPKGRTTDTVEARLARLEAAVFGDGK